MGAAEDANIVALESVAKTLEWLTHPPPIAGSVTRIGVFAPTAADSGVAILTRPKTMVLIPLRENAARFSSRVVVTVDPAGSTYRVNLVATNVDYVSAAGETVAQVIDGIRDAINGAGGPVSTEVIATSRDTDADDSVDEVLIQQKTSDTTEHVTLASMVAGAGTITANEDLSSLSVDVWGKMSGTNAPPQWTRARGGTLSAIDRKGIHERLSTAAYERLYVELIAVTTPTGGATLPKVIVSLGTGIV